MISHDLGDQTYSELAMQLEHVAYTEHVTGHWIEFLKHWPADCAIGYICASKHVFSPSHHMHAGWLAQAPHVVNDVQAAEQVLLEKL